MLACLLWSNMYFCHLLWAEYYNGTEKAKQAVKFNWSSCYLPWCPPSFPFALLGLFPFPVALWVTPQSSNAGWRPWRRTLLSRLQWLTHRHSKVTSSCIWRTALRHVIMGSEVPVGKCLLKCQCFFSVWAVGILCNLVWALLWLHFIMGNKFVLKRLEIFCELHSFLSGGGSSAGFTQEMESDCWPCMLCEGNCWLYTEVMFCYLWPLCKHCWWEVPELTLLLGLKIIIVVSWK